MIALPFTLAFSSGSVTLLVYLPPPGVLLFCWEEFPHLFHLFHHDLEIVTGKKNSTSCFGSTAADVLLYAAPTGSMKTTWWNHLTRMVQAQKIQHKFIRIYSLYTTVLDISFLLLGGEYCNKTVIIVYFLVLCHWSLLVYFWDVLVFYLRTTHALAGLLLMVSSSLFVLVSYDRELYNGFRQPLHMNKELQKNPHAQIKVCYFQEL